MFLVMDTHTTVRANSSSVFLQLLYTFLLSLKGLKKNVEFMMQQVTAGFTNDSLSVVCLNTVFGLLLIVLPLIYNGRHKF